MQLLLSFVSGYGRFSLISVVLLLLFNFVSVYRKISLFTGILLLLLNIVSGYGGFFFSFRGFAGTSGFREWIRKPFFNFGGFATISEFHE